MSSEEVWVLEESRHPHPNEVDEHDNGGDNGAGSLHLPSPEHLDTGRLKQSRSLTYFNGLAIVISLQVGAGIFSTPAAVRTNVSSPTAALLVWILAGILVWMGAAALIELGTRIPHNGGMQEYLRHCYGDVYGFLFAWAWILVSRPCAMAMVALVFSEYLFKTFSPDHDADIWILKGTALLAITGINLVNLVGTSTGTGLANFFLVFKVFVLGSVAAAGAAFAISDLTRRGQAVFPTAAPEPGRSSLWADMGGFTDAILASLFAYGGCESVSARI